MIIKKKSKVSHQTRQSYVKGKADFLAFGYILNPILLTLRLRRVLHSFQ